MHRNFNFDLSVVRECVSVIWSRSTLRRSRTKPYYF